jgi:hypothetical protein
MDVLHWMKRASVATAFLGVVGYLMFLAWWINDLGSGRVKNRWEDALPGWLHAAQAPLLVILLSVIGYSLTCMAERFRLPRVASAHEEDYGDRRPPPPPV